MAGVDMTERVTTGAAQPGAIDVLKYGLVGRGVLLDVPRKPGVSWLEPSDHIFREDLVRHCEAEGRWEFLFIVAPLRVVGRTGSPVNPIAVF